MININTELRIPLFQDIGGVLFHDMGALSGDRFADFTVKNMLHATGFGLRYNTPIGPLRFDVGFKWGKINLFDRRYTWFLTFGQAF